jgi:hypothetical protein
MLGAVTGVPALGRGPAADGNPEHLDHGHPAAGWGAAKRVARVIARTGAPLGASRSLLKMNHDDGGTRRVLGGAAADDGRRVTSSNL